MSDPITVQQWIETIGEWAQSKGWNDKERTFGDWCALFHSEISEAFESYRNKEEMYWELDDKPEGIATEIADCVIRIFHWCSREGIDLQDILMKKHRFNITRPYRHGNKAQ